MSAVAAKLAAQEKLLAKMQAAADAEDVVSSSSDSDDDDDDDSPAVAPITAAEAMAADFKGIPRGPVIGLGKGKGPAARAPAAAAAAAVSSSSEDDDDGEAEDDDDDEGGQKLDREPPSSGEEEEEEEEEQVQISKPSADKKKTASKRKSKTGASVCPALVTRDSKLSTIHRNPFIGEVFQRGEVFFRVVSTPGGKKDDAYIAHTDNKTYKFFMPSWKDGSIDTHCFDAVNMDDATNIETFVQTDRAHYYTVSQTGAAAMLRHDMSKEVNPPIATRDYKRNAVKSGNRFSSPMDLPNARGDRTWLPWALYHHHINTKNPVGGDETTAAEAAAAASSKKAAAASNKRKAPGANSVPEVPLLLSSLAKKFIDDDLEPFCRRAQSPSEMVTRLDRSLVQFARTWKLDNVDAVISAMSDRYKSTKNSDKNKKIKLDPESIATDAASFAVSLQVRMFMMVHPVGLALVQDLRNKLQKEAMDTDDSANDFF